MKSDLPFRPSSHTYAPGHSGLSRIGGGGEQAAGGQGEGRGGAGEPQPVRNGREVPGDCCMTTDMTTDMTWHADESSLSGSPEGD